MGQSRQVHTDLGLIWSPKSTTAAFHPSTGAVHSASVVEARPTMVELRSDSGDLEVALAYQTSDTGEEDDFGSTTVLSASWVSTTGMVYEDTFTSLSSISERFIRFGVAVRNKTGSDVEVAQVACKVDVRER